MHDDKKLQRDYADRPRRERGFAAHLLGAGQQYDPGIYKMLGSLFFGYLDVFPGLEVWALVSRQAGLPADVMPYAPIGHANTGSFRSVRLQDQVPADQLDGLIPWAFDRIDAAITNNPAISKTGTGGAPPTYPWLFDEGRYDVIQSGTKVGDLIVEHKDAKNRNQYWFLYATPGHSTGVYTWPGKTNSDVTSVIRYSSSFVANQDLDAFRKTLPDHSFLLGAEVYKASYPASP